MNSNPYHSPAIINEPDKPHKTTSHLLTFLDIAGILFSSAPLLGLIVLIIIYVGELSEPSDELVGLTGIAAIVLWMISGVYNIIRALQGRRLSILGVSINIGSFVIWGLLFIFAFVFTYKYN